MKRYGLFLLIIFTLLLTLPVTAQDVPMFEIAADGAPVVEFGSPTAWDGRFTDPGAVRFHDGKFHMFRNGFLGWPAAVQIGYLTSDDGVTWEEATPDPVLMTDDVPYAEVAALASSAVVNDADEWMLYFYTWDSLSPIAVNNTISVATAADPLGEWDVQDAPILTAGGEGEWDENGVLTPEVIRREDGSYVMYYSGVAADSSMMIGMATSDDGITWTKYDDPATTEAPYAESDPVFTPGEADWEAVMVHQPRVVQTEDGQLVMVYRAMPGGPGNMRLGWATSEDGITWQRGGEPIIAPTDIPRARGFWYTALAYDDRDDTLYLYVEADGGTRGTNIYAFTAMP